MIQFSNWDTNNKEWIDDYKYIYSHDINGNLTYEAFHRWNANSNFWHKESKLTYSYYANQLPKLESSFHVVFSTKQWGIFMQTYNEYNPDSSLLQKTVTHWNINTNLIEGKIKNTYNYNSNRDLTQHKIYRWNDSLSIWNLQSKYQFEFDTLGNKIVEESYHYSQDSNFWWGQYRHEFLYDSLHGLVKQSDFTGFNQTNIWYPLKKHEHINDSNNNHLETIVFEYDTATNLWNFLAKGESTFSINNLETSVTNYLWNLNYWWESSRIMRSFDANNQETSRSTWQYDHQINAWKGTYKSSESFYTYGIVDTARSFIWDPSNQIWINTNMYVNNLDSYNNPTNTTFFEYDTTLNTWNPSRLTTKKYTTAYPVSNLIIPTSYHEAYELDTMRYFKWDTISSIWEPKLIKTYYFSSFNLTSIPENVLDAISIYPNPFQNQFIISGLKPSETYQLRIFEVTGKSVFSANKVTGQTLIGTSLKQGIYIYVVTGKEKTWTGKIIKQ